jgi:hypothetical protein
MQCLRGKTRFLSSEASRIQARKTMTLISSMSSTPVRAILGILYGVVCVRANCGTGLGKIRYPPDNNRQTNSQNVLRKSSANGVVVQSPQQLQQMQQQQQLPYVQVSSPNPDDALRTRAASPTQQPRANGSIVQNMSSPLSMQQQQQEPNGLRQSVKAAKVLGPVGNVSRSSPPAVVSGSPPQRPRRDDDPPLNGSTRSVSRATSPTQGGSQGQSRGLVGTMSNGSLQQQQQGPGQEPAQRAMSPPAGSRPRAAPALVVANGSSPSPQNSPPTQHSSQLPSGIAAARAHLVRSPSPNRLNGSASSHDGQEYSHEDGFYYGSNKAVDGGDETKKQKWLRSALSLAAQKGFLLPQPVTGDKDEETARSSVEGIEASLSAKDSKKVVEALVLLKQDLAKAKVRDYYFC